MTSVRVELMKKGIELTTGDRNKTYGSPHENLTCFAHLVNAYLKGLGWIGPKLDSVDGSIIMNLAKVSRVAANKQHMDNYVDGSVYMAIAGECATYIPMGPRPLPNPESMQKWELELTEYMAKRQGERTTPDER